MCRRREMKHEREVRERGRERKGEWERRKGYEGEGVRKWNV